MDKSMKHEQSPTKGFFSPLWSFFSSVKLTVVVLLALAATSIIGTVIPQNENPVWYTGVYGEKLYRLLHSLNIFDMYHSGWFRFLLLLLTVNLVVCSVARLSSTWKIIFDTSLKVNSARFKKLSGNLEIWVNGPPESSLDRCEQIVSKYFNTRRVEKEENGFCIVAEKGRWTRLGVYFVHLSILFLIVGGMLGSILGFEGFANIPEGETINAITLKNTGEIKNIDFSIRCDDFSVSFYDTGAPKEYRSSLSIVEDGQIVRQQDILVNTPLRYRGINIFQSSYGKNTPEVTKEITVNFTSQKSGMVYSKKIKINELSEIPEDLGQFLLTDVVDAFEFKGQKINEKAFIGELIAKDGTRHPVALPLRYPNFDRMRGGEVFVFVSAEADGYYTGIQVTKDPGVLLVYAGFLMMIVGCYITFFMSHQSLCILAEKDKENTRIMVSGTANKNKLAMKTLVKKITHKLAQTQTGTPSKK